MRFSLKRDEQQIKNDTIAPEIQEVKIITTEKEQEKEQEKEEENLKNQKDEVWEYVRVVNVRGDIDFQATYDEKVIIVHRDNLILGNQHPMKKQTMDERDRVIAAYKQDLKEDLKIKGPMYQLLYNIAEDMVYNKQKIALQCFCAPLACHGSLLIPVIVKMAHEIIEMNNNVEKDPIKSLKKKM